MNVRQSIQSNYKRDENMLKVFLVEDEYIVREGIKNMNWEAFDLSFCGEASDGELAFPLIKKEKPDIVITDIRMPFMDGLELSRLIKKEMPYIKIMILSGHEEFEYAKSAIQIGVEEYLLKPINREELMQAVRRVADKIEIEKEQIGIVRQQDEGEAAERMENAKREFFGELIGGEATMSELLEHGRELGMELTASYYQIMLLKAWRGQGSSYSGRVVEIVRRLQEYIAVRADHMICFDRAPEGKIILFLAEDKEELQKQVEKLTSFFETMLGEYKGVAYFGSIGCAVSRFRELSHAYETACHAFAYRFLLEGNMVIRYEEVTNQPLPDTNHPAGEGCGIGKINFANLDKSRVEAFLRGGEQEEIRIFVEEYICSAGEAGENSLIFRQYILMDMYIAASHFLEQLGAEEAASIKEPFDSPEQMEKVLCQIESTKGYLVDLFQKVMSVRDRCSREFDSDIVKLAKKYIDGHYSNEELSLNLVASEVNVSPNHLSAMFSQKTGHTFVRYLTDVRMNKARELLKCTGLRSNEISDKIGYKDPHYFSHLFKKHHGCTPIQYREGGGKG